MIHAVNRRARELLRFKVDPKQYPRHDYAYDDDPSPAVKQPPSSKSPPPNPSSSAAIPKSRRELYNDAFKDVSRHSGSEYTCKQSDLDATGGLARQDYPDDRRADRSQSRKKWFPHENHGPFITARQASLDILEHNKLHRRPGSSELEAIERLSKAIDTGRAGSWGPDLIIKAFCDLDAVFYRGRLRGHVCVRWLPDWSERGHTIWGSTVFLAKGKSAIRMNAKTILLKHPEPFERMFATMLHEMW